MSEFLTIIILTGAAGICIPIGGAIASFESIRPGWVKNELKHFVIALGGGLTFFLRSSAIWDQNIRKHRSLAWKNTGARHSGLC